MAIGEILYKNYSSPNALTGTGFRAAFRSSGSSAEGGEGDSVNFSSETLKRLASRISKNDNMTASAVSTTLVDGDSEIRIAFNNSNGTITWNGNNLNLKNFANSLKDDLVVKNAGDTIEVYNLTTQQKITLNADGSQQLADGMLDESSIEEFTGTAASLSSGLFINNKGLAATSSGGNDILINRQADALLNAGLGDDKIFNFAATAGTLNGGGGNDAVYSVGLTQAADINVSSGDGYVKLLGDMKGGSINLGGGQNYVDASGRTLTGVTVSDSSSAEASVVVAKTVTGGSNVSLNAALTALDVTQLTSSSVSFGTGVNSLMADKITGTEGDQSSITSKGTNTYQVGTVTYTKFDSSGAVSDAIKATGNISDSEFSLSKGENKLDATGKTLTAVKVTSAQGDKSSTTLLAGSIVGRSADTLSIIDLASGTASGDNTITVSGAVRNADISTGAGAGTLSAGSADNVILSMGGSDSTKAQSLTIGGKANKLDYTGSKGDDTIIIKGAISNSGFDLGEGDNSLTAQSDKGVNQTVSNTNIKAGGSGATTLVMGSYAYSAKGNTIELGSGANNVTMGKISGSGTEGLTMEVGSGTATQNITVNGSASYFTYNGASGDDILEIMGAVSNSAINLGDGNNTFTAKKAGVNQGVSNTNITGGDGSNTLTMGKYTYSAAGNNITLGKGVNNVTVGTITGKGTEGLTVNLSDGGANDQTLTVNGSANYLTYLGAAGKDTVSTTGSVSNSTINLGDGDNSFTARSAAGTNQKVSNTNISGGDGSNTLTMGTYTYSTVGNTITLGKGVNNVTVGTITGKGTEGLAIDLSSGGVNDQTLIVNGSVNRLTYTGGAGKDTITTTGSVSNSEINLGDGDNSFTARSTNDVNQKVSNTNIAASGNGSTTLVMGTYTYKNTTSEAEGNSIVLGNGSNSITMGSITGSGTAGLKIDLSAATSQGETLVQTLIVNGGAKNLKYTGSDGKDDITVRGAVSNSDLNLGSGDNSFTAQNTKNTFQTVTNTNITATGTGSTTLKMGNYVYSADGNLITLGDGANTIEMGSISGRGTAGLEIDLLAAQSGNQNVTLRGKANYLTYNGSNGNDTLTAKGAVSNSDINFGIGTNSFIAQSDKLAYQTVSNTNITAGGSTTVKMGNYVYSASRQNEITLGNGANTVEMGSISGKGTTGLELNLEAAKTGAQNVTVRGSANRLTYNGGDSDDTLWIKGAVNNSEISLGEGTNSFTARNDKGVYQALSNTNVTASGSAATTVDVGKITYGVDGNTLSLGSGANTVTVNGSITGKGTEGFTVDLSRAAAEQQTMIINGSATRLTYEGSAADDSVNVTGTMTSSFVNLGEGSNSFTANGAKSKVTDTSITASGNGSNTVDITSFAASKNGGSELTLGSGDDTVNLGTTSGNVTVDMGGGANNTFTSKTLNGTTLKNGGGGTYTINTGKNATLDFTGSSDALRLNIQTSLTNTLVDLGNGDVHIGSEYDEGKSSTASFTGSTINGGAGKLTVDAKNITSSRINMKTENAGDTGRLDLSVNGTMNAQVDLGHGENTINANIVKNSVINRTETGELAFDAKTVTGTTFNLTGAGSDTLNVTGDLNGTLNFSGEGGDSVTVGGAISGTLTNMADMVLTATKVSGLNATLHGNNVISTNTIDNSKLIMGYGTNIINEIPEVVEPVEDGEEGASGENGESTETTEPAETDNNHRLNITNSLIQSGTDMTLNAHDVTSSTLTMKAQEGGSATLNLDMTGTLKNSVVNLSGGDSTMTVDTITNSDVNRTEDGSLTLDAGSINGGDISLTGEGEDTITVTEDMNANVTLGDGADKITVGGTVGGSLTASGNVTVTARNMSAMEAYLSGAQNRLDIAELVKNSKLDLGDGDSTVGNAETIYSGTAISAGAGSNTILGSGYSGGSVSMGADGKTNEFLVTDLLSNTTVTLNGGTNTVGGTGLAVTGSTITGTAAGDNTIRAASLGNSKIILGESNDHVDIFGNITGSTVSLGEGVNTLRNTATAEEAAANITGQGSAVNNKVQNSTIQVDGGTNVFLGQVSDKTTISGTGANNINVAGLTASTIDASEMEGGQIGIGLVKNGEITAGRGGSININTMQSGSLKDGTGQNDIVVGNLGELATINVEEAIHSTTIHVNTLDGTLNLLNENYAGSKQGNLTLANQNYDGTVKIGDNKVTGAGTAAPAKDTSGFGLDNGDLIE